jgi:hypothetical protein
VTDDYGRGIWADDERSERGRSGDEREWDAGARDPEARWQDPAESGRSGRDEERWEAGDAGGRDAWDDADDVDDADGPDGGDDRGTRWGESGEDASEGERAPAGEAASAWAAPAEEEDELRSFVESEALPSEERMAAAELEAEQEAARDAAVRRAHADEAGLEGAVAPPPGRRGMDGRSVDGRLARLHLKGGLIALARAELETMAGQVSLDLEALADLAEARWRSGDLLGAGEAAQAHIARGGDELIALVVAVEALTAQGRTIDARRLAGQVLDRTEGDLDPVFAGQPRAQLWSRPADVRAPIEEEAPPAEAEELAPERPAPGGPPVWPDESRVTPLENIPPEERVSARLAREPETSAWPVEDRPSAAADRDLDDELAEAPRADEEAVELGGPSELREPAQVGEPADSEGHPEMGEEAREVAPAAPPRAERGGRPSRPPGPRAPALPREAGARRELAAIEAALREGRLEPVTGRLALLLRTEPEVADRVAELSLAALALAGASNPESANLYIVRGDALRVLGRSEEADLAYEQSRRALIPGLEETEEPEEGYSAPAFQRAEPFEPLEPGAVAIFEQEVAIFEPDVSVDEAEPFAPPETIEPEPETMDEMRATDEQFGSTEDVGVLPADEPVVSAVRTEGAVEDEVEGAVETEVASEQPSLFADESAGTLPAAGVSEPAEELPEATEEPTEGRTDEGRTDEERKEQ